MGALLDILGAIIIGGMLLMVLITFNFQLVQTANRNVYAAEMTDRMEAASVRLNYLMGLVGVGMGTADKAVVGMDENKFVFNSCWNFADDSIGTTAYEYTLFYDAEANQNMGGAIVLRQGNNIVIEDMGYILWVDDLKLKYYDMEDDETSTASEVRSVELWISFSRAAPQMDGKTLNNRLQLRCYMMNAYLQEGTS